jgi:pseudaminic acid biosynthesis-associated methylase
MKQNLKKNNYQEIFWQKIYGEKYIKKNSLFDLKLGIEAWKLMLKKIKKKKLDSILECGCNIGKNLSILEKIYKKTKLSVIEINKKALFLALKNHDIFSYNNGSIKNSNFKYKFDLVFTCGVLIHIPPNELNINLNKIYNLSKKYILIVEYFNPTPVSIVYQKKKNLLFKNDFGKIFIENHNVKIIDNGFLWSHLYGKAGFGDLNWWLFEKKHLSDIKSL